MVFPTMSTVATDQKERALRPTSCTHSSLLGAGARSIQVSISPSLSVGVVVKNNLESHVVAEKKEDPHLGVNIPVTVVRNFRPNLKFS